MDDASVPPLFVMSTSWMISTPRPEFTTVRIDVEETLAA